MKTVFIFAFLFTLFACSEKQNKGTNENSLEAKAAQTAEKEAIGNYVVEPIDEERFDQLIKQRNGKYLLLNVWATWCVPCIEEFPDLIRLVKEYENSNFEIVGLSVDYPDEVESKIVPFLKKHQVNFRVYVRNFKDDQKFINRLNPNWSGAVPATAIYDSQGTQKTFFIGKHSLEEFQKEIEEVRF